MLDQIFLGFEEPKSNFSRLPHAFIEALPLIKTIAEMKVILYILRHTWGFGDESKRITIDEFEKGRKRRDGSRIDDGVGMSRPSIIDGLKKAAAHGFITVELSGDPGRQEKTYAIHMTQGDQLKDLTPPVKSFNRTGKESLPRSEKETKKETLELKDSTAPQNGATHVSSAGGSDVTTDGAVTESPASVLPDTPKKEKPRDVIFDAVALGSFGLEDVNGDKVAGARIGKIAAWLKKRPEEMTGDMIMAFYAWYDRENQNASRPRDVSKFAEHWLKWQTHGAKVIAPRPEPISVNEDWQPLDLMPMHGAKLDDVL